MLIKTTRVSWSLVACALLASMLAVPARVCATESDTVDESAMSVTVPVRLAVMLATTEGLDEYQPEDYTPWEGFSVTYTIDELLSDPPTEKIVHSGWLQLWTNLPECHSHIWRTDTCFDANGIVLHAKADGGPLDPVLVDTDHKWFWYGSEHAMARCHWHITGVDGDTAPGTYTETVYVDVAAGDGYYS